MYTNDIYSHCLLGSIKTKLEIEQNMNQGKTLTFDVLSFICEEL